MKYLKPYLFFISLAMLCTSANAQLYNGRFYRLLQGPQAYEFGRFKTELVPPYQLSALADTGSIAFNSGKWYGKRNDSTWVELGSSSTLTTVADTTARNAIAGGDRYEGMIVYVTSEQKYYSLKGGLANVNWSELAAGGSIISTGGGAFIIDF